MKKFKFGSFILASAMFLSTVSYTSVPVYAGDEPGSIDPSDNGMVISKTAKSNGDGTYEITLEAYATGEKIISEVTKDQPSDIVLVLDQSGSMSDTKNNLTKISFEPYSSNTNSQNYNLRHNGSRDANLWYKLSDGRYVSVSVTRENKYTYEEYSGSNSDYYYAANWNNLFVKNEDGTYSSVTVDRAGSWKSGYTYTYKVNGSTIGTSSGNASPDIKFYKKTTSYNDYSYTYTYTDNDETKVILISEGKDNICETIFYKKITDTSLTRLQALKNAVTIFADSVAEKAEGEDKQSDSDDVKHRIAVVGFAHGTDNTNKFVDENGEYLNTELFIGDKQYKYGDAAKANYINAYQEMWTEDGQSNINKTIEALTGEGATQIDLGMEMAKGILDANPVDTKKRNQIVIVFTDGYPSSFSTYSSQIATDAIDISNQIKTKNVTVYVVGVFDDADDQMAGSENGATDKEKCNWFLQNLSSNDGIPQDPSYYLSTTDADALNEIFKQISEKIDSGQSSTTLKSDAILSDIIEPQFSLPSNITPDDIKIKTYRCVGEDDNGYTWELNEGTLGAKAEINEEKNKVNVTGFDYSANYVCPVIENNETVDYQGNKLQVSFTVYPSAGFLGGNNVYTNTSAGIYKDSSSDEAVVTFESPQVNVPIGEISVTAADENIYILGSVTGSKLKADSDIYCGKTKINLDPSVDNYGLESWQTAYVKIDVKILDGEGNEINETLSDLDNDKEYQVQVVISPKSEALKTSSGDAAATQIGQDPASINVFKPVVTFKDSTVFYGEPSPSDYSYNTVSTVWKHGETSSTDTGVTMIGTVPTLDLTFTPEAGKITDNIINTKQDIGVNVTAKIGDKELTPENGLITYGHVDCKESEILNDFEFWLHVNTGTLKIQKIGGADKEPYLFEVFKKNGDSFVKYTEATITFDAYATEENANSVTIYELPAGEYKVVEDTNWSWRYEVEKQEYDPVITYENSNNSTSILSSRANASATITNKKTLQYWLNGFSDVVRNVFRVSKP